MKRTKLQKLNSNKCSYAVVKFIEKLNKLFEGIPESWFVDEEQTSCFWPPKRGRSVTLRAIDQDEPDWDWEVYECEVVSLGHGNFIFCFSRSDVVLSFTLIQKLIALPPVSYETNVLNLTTRAVQTIT